MGTLHFHGTGRQQQGPEIDRNGKKNVGWGTSTAVELQRSRISKVVQGLREEADDVERVQGLSKQLVYGRNLGGTLARMGLNTKLLRAEPSDWHAATLQLWGLHNPALSRTSISRPVQRRSDDLVDCPRQTQSV